MPPLFINKAEEGLEMRDKLEKIYWDIVIEDIHDDGVFRAFYVRFIETLKIGLDQWCEANGIGMLLLNEEFITALTGTLQKISLRTLLVEMQLADKLGELSGKLDTEKYVCFAEDYLADREYLQDLSEIYSEMWEALFQTLENTYKNVTTLLQQFEADRQELNRYIFVGNPCGKIVEVGGGSSDSHNGGKHVYWLLLDNGERIVYKPRNLVGDEIYHRFVEWIADALGISYRWNKVIAKADYGWCEWVERKTCESREQLERYYRRNGILLCVSYLLGSEDMHYENLIASGEFPILIDLEMGVGSRGIKAVEEAWPETERIYLESVLQTGLLPLYTWNEDGEGVNVGAFNGAGGQLCPIRIPMIAEAGTVKMHIEYRQPKMGEGKNLATLNGEFVEPYEFLERIQEGFTQAYRFIEDNRELARKKMNEFCGVPVRFLIRDTQQYAMILTASYLPKFLTEKADRRQILSRLVQDGMDDNRKMRWVTRQEEEALLAGDIPYFWYDAWRTSLYSGSGECYENYFSIPVSSCLNKRLDTMGKTDLVRQQKLIRGALLIGTKGKKRDRRVSVKKDEPDACLRAAEIIGDLLLEEAIWSDDRTSLGWISIVMAGYQERGYLMRPMGRYLYNGLAGNAIFLAQLALKGNDRFKYPAEILIRQLFEYTDKLSERTDATTLPTGAFTGEASLAYAYILLYELSEHHAFLEYVEKQCRIVSRCLQNDQYYDVLGGNAGAILVFLKAYEQTGQRKYLEWAKMAGDVLLRDSASYEWGIGWVNPLAKGALTGFAHGASGMVLAFAKLGYYSGEERYGEAAYQAYRFEQHYFISAVGDWADLRYEQTPEHMEYDLAWCHGRGGILAAYSTAAQFAGGKLRDELEKVIGGVDMLKGDDEEKAALCLCHGALGNVGLLCAAGKQKEAKRLYDNVVGYLSEVDGDKLRQELELQECDNFGLMGGLAGIGYGCLCGPEKVRGLLMV